MPTVSIQANIPAQYGVKRSRESMGRKVVNSSGKEPRGAKLLSLWCFPAALTQVCHKRTKSRASTTHRWETRLGNVMSLQLKQ